MASSHTLRRSGASLLLRDAVGCSYAPPPRISGHRTFASTARTDSMLDRVKGLFRTTTDRAATAVGSRRAEDRILREHAKATAPDPEKADERRRRKRWGPLTKVYDAELGEIVERVQEHKYSTGVFQLSNRKLKLLADQIGSGKPVDYSILQMQFSKKKGAPRIKSTLALARDHAIAKGLDPARLVVAEAWVNKIRTLKRIDIKARGRHGVRTTVDSRLNVLLKEGETWEAREEKKINSLRRKTRQMATGGLTHAKPIINAWKRPGWQW